jgi:hypothetical protein
MIPNKIQYLTEIIKIKIMTKIKKEVKKILYQIFAKKDT